MDKEAWAKGFLACLYLWTGRYKEYIALRDEFLGQIAAHLKEETGDGTR